MTSPNPDELADYRATLIAIRDQLPACSAEAEEVWSQRVWAGKFRDLQGLARKILRKHGH